MGQRPTGLVRWPAIGYLLRSEATDVDDTGRRVGFVNYSLFTNASHVAVWAAAGSAARVMSGSQPFTDISLATAIGPSGLAVGDGGATVNGQLRPIIWRKTRCDQGAIRGA